MFGFLYYLVPLILFVTGLILIVLCNRKNMKSVGVLAETYACGLNLGVTNNEELIEKLKTGNLQKASVIGIKEGVVAIKGKRYEHYMFVKDDLVNMYFQGYEWHYGSIRRIIEEFKLKRYVEEAIEANQMLDEIANEFNLEIDVDQNRYNNCKPRSLVLGCTLTVIGGLLLLLVNG